ncbi:MAG TPA: S9 family peptidase [Balneolaceae bacterium]|nr:S9 family peptidase [Balneolaceae bacterium]|tara:strand:- start:62729 stop:64648 length:1920 start_codon:yes stop_codon:yes gene_type:complete
MKKLPFLLLLFLIPLTLVQAQDRMTPELLWKLGRVSALGVTENGQTLIYTASFPDVKNNTSTRKYYSVSVDGGESKVLDSIEGLLPDAKMSADGTLKVSHKSVKLEKVTGKELYPEYDESNVYIVESLHYRHWDTWLDGSFNHVMLHKMSNGSEEVIDIMEGQPFFTPTIPFGGDEDYIIRPDGKYVVYVTKQLTGTEYVVSTNTDLFQYNIETGETVNLTDENEGYDTAPQYAPDGKTLAYLSMKRDGYESDKNDIVVMSGDHKVNLTAQWDGTVNGFLWADDGKKIYFTAPVDGTVQVFEVDYPGKTKKMPVVKQLTEGVFDVTSVVADLGDKLIVTRRDMNHATEIYSVTLGSDPEFTQLSHVNDEVYDSITLSKIEKRMMTTTDGKEMLTWVIYPPNFDPDKKYPTLLYAQGGPQGALSQFYSYRWNFQLMAANGYIVVAPNRRGMPGHGVEWNEEISKDWGGQVMDDYLTAIDEMAKEPFVDNDRLGAVGASYGGYSVYYLAGIHDGRFKSFISHDGIFDLRTFYGVTEELFFANWDIGGAYWNKDNKAAQKSYAEFNPVNMVDKWDTPMLVIQGGRDYRVPEDQTLAAFQALQLKGIKSKLLYFPDENHWVLNGQNAIIWHTEFYKWLEETLK